MRFTYKRWDDFLARLAADGIVSITAKDVLAKAPEEKYLVLKHDVENRVKHAFEIAKIEAKHGHRASYYVQAYLLDSEKNVELLRKLAGLGHEVSYHYDVMDFAKGDLELAIAEFDRNKRKFESFGFDIITVCQHGNPIVERVGYTSNRDFFRSERIRQLYPEIADVMVNFKTMADTDYNFFSDAGRRFKLIYDPINNDVVHSEDKDIPYDDLDAMYSAVTEGNSVVSSHPHRWESSAFVYAMRTAWFRVIRGMARPAAKIPFMKKFMSKHYGLAKRI